MLFGKKKYTRSNDARWFSDNHDHILVYCKNKIDTELNLLPRNEEQLSAYSNPDNHPKGKWKATPLHAKSGKVRSFEYVFKNGVKWSPPPGTYPRYSKDRLKKLENDDAIWFGIDGKSTPARKSFLSEVKEGVTPITIWTYEDVGHNHGANQELKDLSLGGIFENPKPTKLLKRMITLSTHKDDIILDFFAGSCTTAQAVLEHSKDDFLNRRFIMVQIPEPTEQNSEAKKAGFHTISDIGKERIRRVIQKINRELNESEHVKIQYETDKEDIHRNANIDLGFKVFNLDESNFKVWSNPKADISQEELKEQLDAFTDHISPKADTESILYELILKSGYPLTVQIEEEKIAGKTVYSIQEHTLVICLDYDLSYQVFEEMLELKPQRVVCLDRGFTGDDADALKTNVVQLFKSHGIEFRTV